MLMLTACVRSTPVALRNEPFPIYIPAICIGKCENLPLWLPDSPDGSALWDDLGAQQPDISALYYMCDAARDACVRTLLRLQQAGIIRIK